MASWFFIDSSVFTVSVDILSLEQSNVTSTLGVLRYTGIDNNCDISKWKADNTKLSHVT